MCKSTIRIRKFPNFGNAISTDPKIIEVRLYHTLEINIEVNIQIVFLEVEDINPILQFSPFIICFQIRWGKRWVEKRIWK